jgi:hypothetical protein
MARVRFFFLGLVLIVAAACGSADKGVVSEGSSEQAEAAAESAAPANEAAAPSTAEIKQVPKKESATQPRVSQPQAPQPRASQPQAPQPVYATLEAGTIVPVRLQDPLDSSINKAGDTFRAVVDQDILAGNDVLVPRGSIVEGTLTSVQQSGRVKGRAAMSMQFVSLTIGNQTYPIESDVLSFEAEATKAEDATKVGIGSGIGAVIGAIAGGGKGAAIGAAVGAGAGGATVAATRGKELKYDVEHPLNFTLRDAVKIRLR